MKSFCLLEQGRSVGDPLVAAKRNLFTRRFCDYYRLNWARLDDPDAAICEPGIVWSEGRALLYEKVAGRYAYYIFADDDVEFSASSGDIATSVAQLLEQFRPLTGTFIDIDRFTSPNLFNFLGTLEASECLARPAFPVAGYDQQVQLFSASYAATMFPPPYHGAGMSMWYSQWVCFRQFPRKQVCFTEVTVRNLRTEPHSNETRPQHTHGAVQVPLFNADVHDRSYRRNLREILNDNSRVFSLEADPNPVEYSLDLLAELYDVNSVPFRERSAIVRDKVQYLTAVANKAKHLRRDAERHAHVNQATLEEDRLRKAAAR